MKADHPLNTSATNVSLLLRSLRGQVVTHTPVWFMRQAGRSLPEYRKLREGTSMLESCLDPDLVVEITMQPVTRHNVDAAIFFSDIVIPLKLAGVDVDIQPGVGPVIANPIRDEKSFAKLQELDLDALAPIRVAVAELVMRLGEKPLIGFGGAPFTLASYLIEGGPSRDLPETRKLMENPELFEKILNFCADVTATFIRAQVEAGASAMQVFDSWAGKLSPEEYRNHAKAPSRRLFDQLSNLIDDSGQEVPRIHFGLGCEPILSDMLEVGATALGVDHFSSLRLIGEKFPSVPLQGNLNPELLFGPWSDLESAVHEILDQGEELHGHVFNLGHGVPKETNPEVLTKVVSLIHSRQKN
jgi:uroporphyrinogen decarboxylase